MTDKNKYEFTGQVVHVGEIQEFGQKGFYKADLVLNDNADQYPKKIAFEATKERADEVQQFNLGDTVTVQFDLRGREWKGRWFVNLHAWRIQRDDTAAPRDPEPELDSEDDDSGLPPF